MTAAPVVVKEFEAVLRDSMDEMLPMSVLARIDLGPRRLRLQALALKTAETTSSTTRCVSTMAAVQVATIVTTRTSMPARSRHLGAHHQSIPRCALLIQLLTSNLRNRS